LKMTGRNSKWCFGLLRRRRRRVKLAVIFGCIGIAFTAHAQEFLDRVDQMLSLSVLNDQVRAHLSVTLALEVYNFQQPAPGLIDSHSDTLFNPRLTLFLDAQAGSQIYAFTQVRLDRNFDPRDHGGAQLRLEEYAVRVTPWEDGRFTIQIGKFAT